VRPAVAEPSLEPYAQLLRALLPRMNSLSVFNALGELHWSTEMAVEPALMALLRADHRARRRATRPASGEQCDWRAASRPTCSGCAAMDAEPATPFAVVAISFKPGNADADLRAFSFVQALVSPASNACGASCWRATRS
jgi:hypothetical protein